MGGAPRSWGVRKRGCGKLSEKKRGRRNPQYKFSPNTKPLYSWGPDLGMARSLVFKQSPLSPTVKPCHSALCCRVDVEAKYSCASSSGVWPTYPTLHLYCLPKGPGKALPTGWHHLEKKNSLNTRLPSSVPGVEKTMNLPPITSCNLP